MTRLTGRKITISLVLERLIFNLLADDQSLWCVYVYVWSVRLLWIVAVTLGLRDSGTTTATAFSPRAPHSPLSINSDRPVTECLTATRKTPLLSTILRQQHPILSVSSPSTLYTSYLSAHGRCKLLFIIYLLRQKAATYATYTTQKNYNTHKNT